MRSVFGWSYPPGCSGPPDDDVPISPLQEEVGLLLEDAGMSQDRVDAVMKLINDWEVEKQRERQQKEDHQYAEDMLHERQGTTGTEDDAEAGGQSQTQRDLPDTRDS